MLRWRVLAPVAALAVTGCMASKADIVLLQDEIRTLRAMEARTDSSRRIAADSAILLSRRTNDSLKAFAQRFGAFQSNINGELFEMQRQLITIQELTGLSSKRIMDLRSSIDERQQSASADTNAPPSAPTPSQLYSSSFDQWRRGSLGTARTGFEELLRRYPDFDQASSALAYVGQIYDAEKKPAQADSVYLLVVARYPKSNDAPTALYKYGLSQKRQGKPAEAREAMQRVMREYPRSTEATLAEEALKTIK